VDRIASWRTLPDGSWGLESAVPVTVYEPRWYDWLVRRSQILTKVRLRLSTALNGEAQAGAFEKTLHDDFDPRALEIFRTNLRLLQSTTRLLGMQLLVGKQATLIVPGLSEADRRRCRYELHAMSHDAHLRAFEAIYRVIEEEFPRDHIIDATPLSGVSENFYDHIHPTPLGAERTAQLMADALEPYVEAIERTAPAAAAAR
jgi:hypothetical protein